MCSHLPEGGEDEEELCLYESRHNAEETKTGSAMPRNPRKPETQLVMGEVDFSLLNFHLKLSGTD